MSTSQINPIPPEEPEDGAGQDPDLATPDVTTRPDDDSPLTEHTPEPADPTEPAPDPTEPDDQLLRDGKPADGPDL